jgi:hypothetical protein
LRTGSGQIESFHAVTARQRSAVSQDAVVNIRVPVRAGSNMATL